MENKIEKQGIAPAIKKVLSLLLSLVMLFSITAGIDLSAYAAIRGDFEYEVLADGTVSITGYNGSASKLTIPSTIYNDKVTHIADEAFFRNTNLESIILPDSIISIGDHAFYGCSNLSSINLPNGVTQIEPYVFCDCISLTSIHLPNGVTSIDDSAFYNCESLENIVIPDSVTSIGEYAFFDCRSLTNVNIPNGIKYIEPETFHNCESLTSINIPDSVTYIGMQAFYGCTGLTDVTIPGSVKNFGETPFGGCTNLKNVVFQDGITWICDFNNCESLTNITIPDSVTTIWGYTFYNCKSLTSINIPNGVTSILDYTFYDCIGLASINIPVSVTSVENFAFSNCSSLSDVYYSGTMEEWNKIFIGRGNEYLTKSFIHCSDGVINCNHSYDAGKVTKAPTTTATGIKTYTCTKCNATKTETIPKLKLSAPTLKATVNANGTFTLSWNKVTGADKYEIYYKQTDGSYKLLKTVTGTSYTTVFAQYGKQYSYKMKAVKGNTKSDYSNVVNATNNKKLQTPTLKVAVNSNGTFKMTWNKVTGATSYQIYWKQTDGSYKLLKTVTGTSYTSGFAQYGKQYSYKMKAVTSKNSSATSAYSSVVNATNNKKLQTPTLKVSVNSNGTFKMTWNKVAGATSYQIYYKQADGSYKLLKTVTGTSYTSGFAQYGKQYSYKVRAVTSKNSSATSNFSSVVNAKNTKKLGTPTMKATVNKNGSFKLSWGKVTGATSYQIYWKQANGSYKLLKTVTGTSYTTVVAAKGKTYNYKVRAVTKNNSSAASNYSSVVSAKRK